MNNRTPAALRDQPGGRQTRPPIEVAAGIAEALERTPRGKRTEFVEIAARELGVCVSWVYICTHPFRRRLRAYGVAVLATALESAPHGARVALFDDAARRLGVSRATVYRWIQPLRRLPRGRVRAYSAAEIAREAARTAGMVIAREMEPG